MNSQLSRIHIEKLNKNNLAELKYLIGIFMAEFESEGTGLPPDEYLTQLLHKEYFGVFVAKNGNQVVGGATTYELIKYYSENSELYIYDIAIQKEFQNLGIGKKIMVYLRNYGSENGMESIYVQAESDNTQAIRFYESTIGIGEKVEHFTIDFNE